MTEEGGEGERDSQRREAVSCHQPSPEEAATHSHLEFCTTRDKSDLHGAQVSHGTGNVRERSSVIREHKERGRKDPVCDIKSGGFAARRLESSKK